MAVDELDPRVLAWRIRQTEDTQREHIRESDSWRREVDGDRTKTLGRLDSLERAYVDLRADLRKNTRMLMTLAISISGSAVVFAMSVLVATGKL